MLDMSGKILGYSNQHAFYNEKNEHFAHDLKGA